MIAEACSLPAARIVPRPWRTFGWAAQRPGNVSLGTIRGQMAPSLESAVARFAESLAARAAGAEAARPRPGVERRAA